MKTRLIDTQPKISDPDRKPKNARHFRRPEERPFTKEQRADTTVLVGGLTRWHDTLVEGALIGLGLKAKALSTMDMTSFRLGREYGNIGYCNPAYFTTGNLLKYLSALEDEGLTREEIKEKYVFLTIGCVGPCRFGIYEALYRLVLRNFGFDGFRVVVFQNAAGVNQQLKGGDGIQVSLKFFLILVNALNMADMVMAMANTIRPYEMVPGQTDQVRDEAISYLHDVLANSRQISFNRWWDKIWSGLRLTKPASFLHHLLHQLTSNYYVDALKEVRKMFERVEIDRFRLKTKVKFTGEFWAAITHTEGNYKMHDFLENEGAEIPTDYIGSYLLYLFSKNKLRHQDRKGTEPVPWYRPDRMIGQELKFWKKMLTLRLGTYLYYREFDRLIIPLNENLSGLADQQELQDLAEPYWHRRLEGGEGFMEVAKCIYNHVHEKCHMVLSLKPFGCMPSTQSDGALAAVAERYKDLIFLPVETSGEGEINAHSRVQMAFGDARIKARDEYKIALERTGRTLDELKAYVDLHPELKSPVYPVPHYPGTVGTAANFILHVGELIDRNPLTDTDTLKN